MFKRTFRVVFRPVKNNFIMLPQNYYKVVSTYDTGCLCLQYSSRVHYMSWAPHSGNFQDTEIAINARVAKEIGLNEQDMVKCTLVADVHSLRNVYLTPLSAKDWEIIELSSEKISTSVLDQTRIINSTQILIVWINKSMQVALTVDRLKPNLTYGRIDHTTEFDISPNLYYSPTNGEQKQKLQRCKTASHFEGKNGEQELLRSSTVTSMKKEKRPLSSAIANRSDKMERLKKELVRDLSNFIELRVISGEWSADFQIGDVFVNNASWTANMDHDAVYCLRTTQDREYHVRVHRKSQTEMSQTAHPTVEVNANLMKLLELKELERVVLKPRPLVVNFVEKIELFANKKTHYKIMENAFKRFVIEKTNMNCLLLNQNEVVKLEDDLVVTVSIEPVHFRYCTVDAQFLKENKIYAADLVRNVDDVINVPLNTVNMLGPKDIIKLPSFTAKVEQLLNQLKYDLCLDFKNSVLRQGNILLAGASGTGKTVVVERILNELTRKPYFCYFDIFYCTRSKGRKAESIQKDVRALFTACLQNAPSIVVLENLDVLAHAAGDQPSQDGEYFNRVADIIHQLIVQYTSNQAIAVIATVNDVKSLNKRLYSPRGRHLFQTVVRMPVLEKKDREILLQELCNHIDTENLDLQRFAILTEGYNKGELVQFVERAIFYAYRINKGRPLLVNEHLFQSLENTNSYCLQGIESHQNMDTAINSDELLNVRDIPGLECVVSVLEEVLLWPSQYPAIFNASPLRNQSGILLYGPPGTGKTFMVSKLARSWNLRIISVKGPELLAKYIGQSEENVRNLFNRARSAKPCVLFFDEFDSLAPKRGHDSTGVTDRVVNQLLTELDGVEGLTGVIVVAATSRPELLDPALLRSGRIDRLVECTLPNATARLSIFEALSSSLNLDENVDFEYFTDKTENYTGADIQSILTSANMMAVKEAIAHFGHEVSLRFTLTKHT